MNKYDDHLIKRFKLTVEQAKLYTWLKVQGLNTDDPTLCFWTKKYPPKRIMEVVNFAKARLKLGEKIQNLGGWVNMFLKKGLAVVNDNSTHNLTYLNEFIEEQTWMDVQFY